MVVSKHKGREKMISLYLNSKIENIPEEFKCPISMDLMKDPVLSPCSHSFEKTSILNWINTHTVCPLCRENLNFDQLVLNLALKNTIEKFISDRDEVQKLNEKICKLEDSSVPNEYIELMFNQIKSENESLFNSMKNEKELEINSLKMKIRDLEENQKFQCQIVNVKEQDLDMICSELSPGLNLNGKCSNQACSIYNKSTWVKKGMGTFNINTECYETMCPICSKPFEEVEKFAVFNCAYSIQAKKSCGEKVERIDQKLPPDFSLLIDKIDNFLYMNITTNNL